jgi:hypothetical protein
MEVAQMEEGVTLKLLILRTTTAICVSRYDEVAAALWQYVQGTAPL